MIRALVSTHGDQTPIGLLIILAVLMVGTCIVVLRRDHIKRIKENRDV